MSRTPTPAGTRLARVALAVLAALALLPLGAGTAGAGTTAGPVVHHVLPENGAVLAAPPDHVEIMFGDDLVPGQVDVGIAPDATGLLVALPAPPQVDGPMVVQALPPLPAGGYTVGVRILDRAGRAAQGTFAFTVDPAAPAATPVAAPGDGAAGPGAASWLIPLAATVLLVPAAGVAVRRRVRS